MSNTYLTGSDAMCYDKTTGYGSRQIHFEWSQKVGERTFDGTHVWVNAGEVKS